MAASKGFYSANKDDFWLIKTNEYGIVPENSHLSRGFLAIGTVLLILKIALNKRQRKQK